VTVSIGLGLVVGGLLVLAASPFHRARLVSLKVAARLLATALFAAACAAVWLHFRPHDLPAEVAEPLAPGIDHLRSEQLLFCLLEQAAGSPWLALGITVVGFGLGHLVVLRELADRFAQKPQKAGAAWPAQRPGVRRRVKDLL
jgi:hypothetical protein